MFVYLLLYLLISILQFVVKPSQIFGSDVPTYGLAKVAQLLVSHTYVVLGNVKQGQGLLCFFMQDQGFFWHFLDFTVCVSDKIDASCIFGEFLGELFYFDNSFTN